MNREPDQVEGDELDVMLAAHLRQRLDPQAGRALAAFEASDAEPVRHHRGGGGGTPMRLALASAGLIAALVAIAWAIWPRVDRQPPPVVTNTQRVPAGAPSSLPREIERMVMWETVDERATLVGDQLPVRKLRQEGVEQVHYYDPADRATIRVTVPLVRDVMVQMETY